VPQHGGEGVRRSSQGRGQHKGHLKAQRRQVGGGWRGNWVWHVPKCFKVLHVQHIIIYIYNYIIIYNEYNVWFMRWSD
jgi:hypothetical protein